MAVSGHADRRPGNVLSAADLTPSEYARWLAEGTEQGVSLATDSTCEPD